MDCSTLRIQKLLQTSAHEITATVLRFHSWVVAYLESRIRCIVNRQLYSGYVSFDPQKTDAITRKIITTFGAFSIPCQGIDMLYIPSTHPHKKRSALVIADTTTYQDRLEKGTLPHKHNHFLHAGMDVVVFNPRSPRQEGNLGYTQDVIQVINALKTRDPHQQICIKAYCATGEPVIAAVSALNDPSLSMILDRTYADVSSLARSFTMLAQIPWIHQIIARQCGVGAQQKIQQLRSKILFIAPQDPTADQVLCWKGKNATHEMRQARLQAGYCDRLVTLGLHTDHWSAWNRDEYTQVDTVLREWGLMTQRPDQVETVLDRTPPSCLKTRCVPLLIKTC